MVCTLVVEKYLWDGKISQIYIFVGSSIPQLSAVIQ